MQFIRYDVYDYIILTMIILHWHNLNFPFNIIKHTLKVYDACSFGTKIYFLYI